MFSLPRSAAALALFFFAAPASAQPAPAIRAADLRPHVETLASDAFEGRAPATAGERRTIDYIAAQLAAAGAEPAGAQGSWFQPVELVERKTLSHSVSWTSDGRTLPFDESDIALQGREPQVSLTDAPVIFAGHGARLPEQGIDQLAGADLRGAVAILLFDAPDVPGFPSFSERVRAVTEAGAAAVIAITGADIQWNFVTRNYRQPATKLAEQVVAPIVGAMPIAAAQALIASAGGDLSRLLNEQPGSSFRAVTLPIRARLRVDTQVRPYTSHNVVGRVEGTGARGESILLLGHWDHLGICRAEGEADRICNGAIDNASGIAALIEIAERLASGTRPVRDVLLLATTAEELGLLGAEYFARHPVVPRESILAAVNLDTIAVHPAGEPVAVIGRGVPALDRLVDATIAALGRRLDSDDEAAPFVQRQDGWALTRAGIPTVMVGGSFSDMERLNGFLVTLYHSPDDEFGPSLDLEGAAEDATLVAALVRRLADPAVYARPSASP